MTLTDYWPFTAFKDEEDEEKSYEEEYRDRCDHEEWEKHYTTKGVVEPRLMHFENGYLVIPTHDRYQKYCVDCGIQKGEMESYVGLTTMSQSESGDDLLISIDATKDPEEEAPGEREKVRYVNENDQQAALIASATEVQVTDEDEPIEVVERVEDTEEEPEGVAYGSEAGGMTD